MHFNVHPCIISINYFFQKNSYPICVVSDGVTKSVEVRHRKACKLVGINSLSFDSLVELHFRVQTVLIIFNSVKIKNEKLYFPLVSHS